MCIRLKERFLRKMASQDREYVIAPYNNTFAMYEINDYRLKTLTFSLSGKFRKTNEFKEYHNGREIGIFECDNGHNYLIFNDYSAIQILM